MLRGGSEKCKVHGTPLSKLNLRKFRRTVPCTQISDYIKHYARCCRQLMTYYLSSLSEGSGELRVGWLRGEGEVGSILSMFSFTSCRNLARHSGSTSGFRGLSRTGKSAQTNWPERKRSESSWSISPSWRNMYLVSRLSPRWSFLTEPEYMFAHKHCCILAGRTSGLSSALSMAIQAPSMYSWTFWSSASNLYSGTLLRTSHDLVRFQQCSNNSSSIFLACDPSKTSR
mmetsp:Transcript_35284/g.81391  ORF Transcript_35284/g.81391 Transcript_35284/m.81391 type:complete len:228 (-) Transcript_35284:539-1222(-)